MSAGRLTIAAIASLLTFVAYSSIRPGDAPPAPAPVRRPPPSSPVPAATIGPASREAAMQAELDDLERQIRAVRERIAEAEAQMAPSYVEVLNAQRDAEQERQRIEHQKTLEAEARRRQQELALARRPSFIVTGGEGLLPMSLLGPCKIKFVATVQNIGQSGGRATLTVMAELEPHVGLSGPGVLGRFPVDLGPGGEETYQATFEVPCVSSPEVTLRWWPELGPARDFD